MKTPAEKAEEIYDTYTNYVGEYDVNKHAKQCALIDVTNTIEALEEHQWQNKKVIEYYLEVKQELENYE
jgi:hypothetical protein